MSFNVQIEALSSGNASKQSSKKAKLVQRQPGSSFKQVDDPEEEDEMVEQSKMRQLILEIHSRLYNVNKLDREINV